jgi:uncharacterized protein YcgL (UPF0745 family)
MITFIYKSSRKDGLYLYVPKKDDFSAVPQALFDSMGNQPLFVMEIILSEDKPLAREDVSKVIKNLQTQGFHVQVPPPILNLTTFKTAPNYVN